MNRTSEKKKVIILGGGIAGMTAAHELIERGFDVTVYEAKALPGGKARGIPVPDSAAGQHKPLPGEHGFRFFPGFYRHLPHTLSRIPFGKKWVSDNLIATRQSMLARIRQGHVFFPTNLLATPHDLVTGFQSFAELGIPDRDLAHFAERLLVMLTSCQERRFDKWEDESWWEFIGAEGRSEEFQKYCADGVTRSCVACRAREMSARTGGSILLQLLFELVRPGAQVDRVLNGPTNDVWLDPWLAYLLRKGVDYQVGAEVQEIHFTDGRIDGVTVRVAGTMRRVGGAADYYIAALPLERIVDLISPPMRQAEPSLDRMCTAHASKQLRTEWMNGIQYFLRDDVPLVQGHTLYIDSQWSLTSISQRQFWPDINIENYGDGTVHGVLSVDISDWETEGINGKKGIDCTTVNEIEHEVRAQLKAHLNSDGVPRFQDANIANWFLDEDVVFPNPNKVPTNLEPLLVNTKSSYQFRPEAETKIPNLLLAADYVRTFTDLATMEAANEAARRAVNGILRRSGSAASLCTLWPIQEPWIFKPLLWYDRCRYRKGLPNIFDDEHAVPRRPARWARAVSLAAWRTAYLCWQGYRGLMRRFGLDE